MTSFTDEHKLGTAEDVSPPEFCACCEKRNFATLNEILTDYRHFQPDTSNGSALTSSALVLR